MGVGNDNSGPRGEDGEGCGADGVDWIVRREDLKAIFDLSAERFEVGVEVGAHVSRPCFPVLLMWKVDVELASKDSKYNI